MYKSEINYIKFYLNNSNIKDQFRNYYIINYKNFGESFILLQKI